MQGLKAILFDFFCLNKKFLVYNIVGKNLKVKYRRSILGWFWTLLTPVALAFVYYIVFKVIIQVPIENYVVFILSGILPWIFISQTIIEGMETILANGALLSKVYIPTQVYPFTVAVTAFVNLLVTLPVLIGVAIIVGAPVTLNYVWILFYWGVIFVVSYSIGLLAGKALVFLRDLRHLMGIVMQLWMYGTPILYSEKMIPEKYDAFLYINPLGTTFAGIHKVVMDGVMPSWDLIYTPFLWGSGIMMVALIVIKKYPRTEVEFL